MNLIYNILISIVAGVLLAVFVVGAIKDAKKNMRDLRESRDKKKHHPAS